MIETEIEIETEVGREKNRSDIVGIVPVGPP